MGKVCPCLMVGVFLGVLSWSSTVKCVTTVPTPSDELYRWSVQSYNAEEVAPFKLRYNHNDLHEPKTINTLTFDASSKSGAVTIPLFFWGPMEQGEQTPAPRVAVLGLHDLAGLSISPDHLDPLLSTETGSTTSVHYGYRFYVSDSRRIALSGDERGKKTFTGSLLVEDGNVVTRKKNSGQSNFRITVDNQGKGTASNAWIDRSRKKYNSEVPAANRAALKLIDCLNMGDDDPIKFTMEVNGRVVRITALNDPGLRIDVFNKSEDGELSKVASVELVHFKFSKGQHRAADSQNRLVIRVDRRLALRLPQA